MHKQAEVNGILANLDILGKQQQWLAQQPALKTREESEAQKRVKGLIQLSKDEENE